jgi:hypothetical protein
MVNQSPIQSKAWYTPFWFMVGILFVSCIQSLFLFKQITKLATNEISGRILFNMLFWPSLLFVEAFIYWMIRKRISVRKWVWAHLLFSLFAFVLLRIMQIVIYLSLYANSRDLADANIHIINRIEFYTYWCSIVIGHMFFIIAIIRSRSGTSAQLPPDDNDLLSEIAG